MQATRRWGYFDSTNMRPSAAVPATPSADETKAMEQWDHEDLITRYLLSQRLPDTTAMRLSAYLTVASCWNRVNEEYTAKSVYAQNDLESSFFDMRCPKGGDVRTFLTSL